GAGWVSEAGGTSLPQNISYNSRNGNVPLEYKASQSIEFVAGFENALGDEFTAYITSEGNNEGGNGVDGVAGAYRYGFNGKENDNEVKGEGNQQDYGFRIYDPRLGKFLSVDPLTDDYPELSTYQYASNNPVSYIDLDGLESAARLPDGSIFIPGGSDNLGFKYPQGARLIDVPKGGKDGIKNISNTLDNIPLVGSIKGGVEGAAGYDMEGNKLERGDRFLGVVPYVKNIKRLKQINRVINAVDKADEVNDAAKAANKVDKAVSTEKGIVKNKKAGDLREAKEAADLKAKNPNANVQDQQYLRDADGKILRDAVSGEGRRLDHVVIENGKAIDVVETTSKTANKTKQIDKERRIRDAGGTYVRDRRTKKLVDVKNVPTRESRHD
ncbi:MAG TPA: RHS repeat-associated core domain-containing protein, partial [Chitinophagaceae bacterium]|nr:RHS repeat-associated core domain-containing protein [Chitinophagaceae bacterium]